MTTGQAPIRIKTGNALDAGETTSNVATNTAELEAMRANIDGKDVYPNTVGTEHLSAANAIIHGAFKSGSMMVGSGGVVISSAADGETPTTGLVMGTSALQLIKSGEAIVALDGTTGDATFKGTIASGSTISGTMSTGSIAIGTGGVSIGSSTAGIGIMGNQIFCKNAGVTTILIDGDTGNVTANRFMLTADADSTLDMSLGSLTIGAGTSVGGTTTIGDISTNASNALSAAATAQETADGEIVGFYQNDAPASGMKFGDIWIDTNYAKFPTVNAIFRYQDTSGGSSGALAWRAAASNAIGKVYLNAYTAQSTATGAASTANSKITTFYQANSGGSPVVGPTALAAGDLWVDTGDSNKLYRAYNAGANHIGTAGTNHWVLCQDTGAAAGATAIQPGNGVDVDGSKYITRIVPASGLTISTAGSESGARTNITGDGIAIYNSSSNIIVQADHTNGVYINNPSSEDPSEEERLSLAYGGNEKSWIGAYSSGSSGWVSLSYDIAILSQNTTIASTGDDVGLSAATNYGVDATDCDYLKIGGYIQQTGTGTYNTFAERIDCASLIEAQHFKLDGADGKIYFRNGSTYYLRVNSDGDLIFGHAGGENTVSSGT